MLKFAARALALISATLGILLFARNRTPGGTALWLPKVLAGALAAHSAVAGVVGAALGFLTRAPLTAP